jgi:hypothetical protein
MLLLSFFNEANYIKSLAAKARGGCDEIPVNEPDMERGVRFMFVHDFRVHYLVNDSNLTVTVFSVMYARVNS